jgi:hypothetical protein
MEMDECIVRMYVTVKDKINKKSGNCHQTFKKSFTIVHFSQIFFYKFRVSALDFFPTAEREWGWG